MFKGLYVDKPQHVIIWEAQEPELQPDQVRIRTEFAAIKHGTEFHLFSGQSPFRDRRFDADRRLFVKKDPAESADTLVGHYVGNMIVGTVIETGNAVTGFKAGDRVYCYSSAHELVTKAENEVALLPEAMNEADAVCLDPSLYAFVAVRDSRAGIGDYVVVSGLGAIGLFIVQLLRLSGCLHIIAIDPIEKRRRLATTFGADLTLDPTQCDVGLEVRRYLGQEGADIAIEASGNYIGLYGAMRTVRNCGRIVTLGYYKGRDSVLELGAEWHHNRLEMISSMPVWGNPMREYPLWNEARVRGTLIALFSKKALTSEGILDPIVDLSEAAEAFLDIYHNPVNAIKLGIRFQGELE
jgi:threonine dehydrogenase-like Zn-dependent dehydrogenase